MDITRGEFDEFSTRSSSRSSRSGTRSTCRSANNSSLEILPPETDSESLFMSEELSDEGELEELIIARKCNKAGTNSKEADAALGSDLEHDSRKSQSSSRSSRSLFDEIDDPELKKAIDKMRKYDRILLKKVKRENEVKRQRLLLHKQMVAEFSESPSEQPDVATNTTKYLALMPSNAQLDKLLLEMDKEETMPIFQTQYTEDDEIHRSPPHEDSNSPFLSSESGSDCKKQKGKQDNSAGGRSRSKNDKTDFVKRNIELAKDAGSYVSMTDDEKKRLNELLSDLDDLDLEKNPIESHAFTSVAVTAGQGYTASELDTVRLAEIDERIQMLLPDPANVMIEGQSENSFHENTDVLNSGQRLQRESLYDPQERLQQIQEKLEMIDNEWRNTFERGTPRLTDKELQTLLEQCSRTNSVLSSSRTSSQMTSYVSDSTRSTPRSYTSTESVCNSEFNAVTLNVEDNLSRPLSRTTLDKLLAEARSSLGISDSNREREDSDDDSDSTLGGDFHHVLPSLSGSKGSSLSHAELNVEDFTPSHSPVMS